MNAKRWIFALIGCLALVLTQCTPVEMPNPAGAPGGQPAEAGTAPGQVPEAGSPVPDPVSDENDQNRDATERGPAPGMPERVDPGDLPGGAGVTGEVPVSILEKIIADLARKIGAAIADIRVIRAEEVIWNDGSLGCPQPGVFYTQALVDGYWVILEYEGVEYDYRAAASGYFILCENGLAPILPPGAPDS